MPSTARAKACTPTCTASRGRRSFSKARRGSAWDRARRSASGGFEIHGARAGTGAGAGQQRKIAGYTLANDVSAWDIERENALYLPQSKVYDAVLRAGPVIVTADELPDPYKLEMTCTIMRDGEELSPAATPLPAAPALETLIEYLTARQPRPAGTVLLTAPGSSYRGSGARARRHRLDPGGGDRRAVQYRGAGR